MKEIAILEFVDGKIASLREYWASEVIGELWRVGPLPWRCSRVPTASTAHTNLAGGQEVRSLGGRL